MMLMCILMVILTTWCTLSAIEPEDTGYLYLSPKVLVNVTKTGINKNYIGSVETLSSNLH
ncbi:hypothetical protein B0H22_10889 [Methanohalophilus euhalobius]|uniref:Uncharacterized protein n=1 Tax=Methanohalophilus euhalobius TaxID=51203 RepID=A0A285GBH5_9EURY|nr:hypothetical protein B0H22_10889 [Methanohalophilus euhalobius]TCL11842.1 hypothetical protein C7960_1037 [Methanohalophilus euhalobius]SNY19741.1 hypothetical protein SAMN06295989_1101 [Methanohalophilus euhalobius]